MQRQFTTTILAGLGSSSRSITRKMAWSMGKSFGGRGSVRGNNGQQLKRSLGLFVRISRVPLSDEPWSYAG